MNVPIRDSCSWILKSILKQMDRVKERHQWKELPRTRKFSMKKFYYSFLEQHQQVPWRKIFYDNDVLPRALFTLWLACHDRLATKAILLKFRLLNNEDCVFCDSEENLQHLFFYCRVINRIWKVMLDWMNMDNIP